MIARIFSTPFFLLGFLIFALAPFAAHAQPQGDLAYLLQQTGLKYSAVPDQSDSWVVPFDGSDGKPLREYVSYSNDKRKFAMIFIQVVDREPHHVFSRAMLTKAMELNNDRPGTKFVLDDDNGDIDCQTEVYLPTATPAELKMALNNVASTADKYGAELKGL